MLLFFHVLGRLSTIVLGALCFDAVAGKLEGLIKTKLIGANALLNLLEGPLRLTN